MKIKNVLALVAAIVLINFCISPILTKASTVESTVSDETSASMGDDSSEEPISQVSEPEESSEPESVPEEPISSAPAESSEKPAEPVSSESPVSEAPSSTTTIEYPNPSSTTSQRNTSSTSSRNTSSVVSSEIPDDPIYYVSIPEETDANVSSDVSSTDTSSWIGDSSSEDETALPEVSPGDISVPQVIGSVIEGDKSSKDNLVKGMIAWVCIGIGVVLVLTVIFGSSYSKQSAKNKRVKGRKHYKASKTKRKKRLLSDKYYYR